MLLKFKQRLEKIPDFQNKKYLIAISGGLDSITLAYLFYRSGLNFELAHCNFKLRRKESDDDQIFVENFALKYKIPLHIKICNAQNTEEKNIQIAARNLRYDWFDKLKEKYNFDFIVTAHHLNDSLETFIINLLRGAGLKGLTGIPEKEPFLRPLLDFTRQEILDYAYQNKLQWREDSSNQETKYLRNKIRHQLIPILKNINPNFEKSFRQSIVFLKKDKEIIESWFQEKFTYYIKERNQIQFLDLDKFNNELHKNQFLYYWLKEFGFTDWQAIQNLLIAQSGKKIEADQWELYKHRNQLILQKKTIKKKNEHFMIYQPEDLKKMPIKIEYEILEKKNIDFEEIKKSPQNIAYIDLDKLTFPLEIRKWQPGDYFYPLGMKGKKKISDFYKDEKLSITEKQKIWLFCNKKNIVWVGGKRLDKRYKINNQTKKIIKLCLR